jgi:hypothetical protein
LGYGVWDDISSHLLTKTQYEDGRHRHPTTKTELTTRKFEEEHPGAVSMEDVIVLDIYQLSDEVFGWERYS